MSGIKSRSMAFKAILLRLLQSYSDVRLGPTQMASCDYHPPCRTSGYRGPILKGAGMKVPSQGQRGRVLSLCPALARQVLQARTPRGMCLTRSPADTTSRNSWSFLGAWPVGLARSSHASVTLWRGYRSKCGERDSEATQPPTPPQAGGQTEHGRLAELLWLG